MTLDDLADRSVSASDSTDARWAEYLRHDDKNTIIACAPHGGGMEPGTAEQALRTAASIRSCSGWAFCGYVSGGGAREKYYTTSTDIVLDDYYFLPHIDNNEFDLAIAFHGYSPDRDHPDVYVGGCADRSVREVFATSIFQETDLAVQVAQKDDGLEDDYGGTHSRNIVNRLGDRSIQLEQTYEARCDFREAICRGVVRGVTEL